MIFGGLASSLASSSYIIVNKNLIATLGLKEAVYIGELCGEFSYWQQRGMLTGDGYFYSTRENIESNTGIGIWNQTTISTELRDKGIITVKKIGLPARNYFRINEDILSQYLVPHSINKKHKNKQIESGETLYKEPKPLNNEELEEEETMNYSGGNNTELRDGASPSLRDGAGPSLCDGASPSPLKDTSHDINNNKQEKINKNNKNCKTVENSFQESSFIFGKTNSKPPKKNKYQKCVDIINSFMTKYNVEDTSIRELLIQYLNNLLEVERNDKDRTFYPGQFQGALTHLGNEDKVQRKDWKESIYMSIEHVGRWKGIAFYSPTSSLSSKGGIGAKYDSKGRELSIDGLLKDDQYIEERKQAELEYHKEHPDETEEEYIAKHTY